ncbi:MAG: IPT/TIG domain protein, partial [Tannerella sp.]|nr:IPT/TIG domain protein [Tannerella sp.]
QYYYFDPKDGWAPRIKTWRWKEGSTDLPSNPWKKAMIFCPYDGYSYVHHYNGQLVRLNTKTNEGEIVFRTPQADCYGMAFHPINQNILYIVYGAGGGGNSPVSNTIYTLDITDPEGTYQKLCGTNAGGHRDGTLEVAQFNNPKQVFFDQDGNLYIADYNNHCIRRLNTVEGIVETVVGIPGQSGWKDGGKEEALFNNPNGIVVGNDGSVYVADFNNSRVRKLTIE